MRFAPRGLDKKNQLNILICRIIEPPLLNRMKDASIFFNIFFFDWHQKRHVCFFQNCQNKRKFLEYRSG